MNQSGTEIRAPSGDDANDGGWVTRMYREGDIQAIVALINATEEIMPLGRTTSEEDLRPRMTMPGADPTREVFLVEGPRPANIPEEMPIAFGWLGIVDDAEASTRTYNPRFTVHPYVLNSGLEDYMVRRLVTMAREHEARPETARVEHVEVSLYVREGDETKREALERVGMQFDRHFLTMERPLGEPVDEPSAVEGVNIRPYRFPEDNARARIAFNRAFADHYDFHPDSQKDWDHGISSPSARTDLSWLAEVQAGPETIAGFCICWVYEETNRRQGTREGWIDILGTIREWRGKGLGRSLLLHGLHSLKGEGLDTALLHVDSTSPTGADRLYESVGFRVRYHDYILKAELDKMSI